MFLRIIEQGIWALKTVLALVLIAAVVMSCANVFLRYVLKIGWIAGDEMQVFLMIAIAFLGTIVVSFEQRQLRVDALGHLFPERGRRFLNVFEALLTATVCGMVTYHSWMFLMRIFAMGQRGGTSGIPMWIPHATVTACFAALTLVGLLRLAQAVLRLSTGEARR